jgi:poly-gamma-glutamate synthase PgsB/CapB
VVRLITACLKGAGFAVLAKSTGSKPVIIFPDGEEQEIIRRGSPSILEGKRILKLGAELKVDALVTESMSIHPERSSVESAQMFNPHILVITNVRLDHIAQMGSARQDIANCFASTFPESGTVFIPQEEFFPVFEKTAEGMNARLVQVSRDSFKEYLGLNAKMPHYEFEENIRLVFALAEFLKIDKDVVLRSLKTVKPDFGSLKVWTTKLGEPSRHWHLVSLFAANDPESTRWSLSKLAERMPFDGLKKIGILNLRRDRGDRTVQWLESLNKGIFMEFWKIFVVGEHAPALKRKCKLSADTELYALKSQAPPRIMEKIAKTVQGDAVLVGMGNMETVGRELVEYWDNTGRSCDF